MFSNMYYGGAAWWDQMRSPNPKHSVCPSTPCLESLPREVDSQICTLVGGKNNSAWAGWDQKKLDLESFNPRPAPAREWLWHGHHVMTKSMGPNMRKFASLISGKSQGECTKHPLMIVGSKCCGYNTINSWKWWWTTRVDTWLSFT